MMIQCSAHQSQIAVEIAGNLRREVTRYLSTVKSIFSHNVAYADSKLVTQMRRLKQAGDKLLELARLNFERDTRAEITEHCTLLMHLLNSVCELMPDGAATIVEKSMRAGGVDLTDSLTSMSLSNGLSNSTPTVGNIRTTASDEHVIKKPESPYSQPQDTLIPKTPERKIAERPYDSPQILLAALKPQILVIPENSPPHPLGSLSANRRRSSSMQQLSPTTPPGPAKSPSASPGPIRSFLFKITRSSSTSTKRGDSVAGAAE